MKKSLAIATIFFVSIILCVLSVYVARAADTTPPDTLITVGPSSWINVQSATFTWTGSDDVTAIANLVYSWKLDGGAWSAYSSATSTTLTVLTEGSHTFDVIAKDEADNVDPTPASQSFNVDITAPSVTITAPVNGAWYQTGGVPVAAYIITDNLDSAPIVVPSGYSTAEGVNTYTVTATDAAGNVGSDSVTYTVDNTAPVVTINAPVDGGYYQTSAVPAADFSVVELNPYDMPVETGYSTVEGVHTYSVTVTDAAGNVGSDSVTYTVDNTAPTVTLTVSDPLISDADVPGTFTLTLSFSEAMNKGVYPSGSSGFVPPVTDTLTTPVPSWNLAGDVLTITWTVVDVNAEVPDIDIIAEGCRDLAGNLMVPNTLVDALDIDTAASTVVLSLSDYLISDDDIPGTFSVTLTFSEAMNKGVYPSGSSGFVPPVTDTLTTPVPSWNLAGDVLTITWTVVDVNAEVPDIDIIAEGCRDLAGNLMVPNTLVDALDIDTAAPSLTENLAGTLGLDGWYTTDVTVTLTGWDGGSGLASVDYNLNSGGWVTYTVPFTVATEGENTLAHRATDNAGNIYVLASQIIKVDNTPPVVTINAPVDGAYYKTVDVPSWSVTVYDSLDPTPSLSVSGYSTVEGVQTFLATATDAAGNVGSDSVTYTVDNTAPVVTINAPVDGAYYKTVDVPSWSVTVYDSLDPTPSLSVSGYSTVEGVQTFLATATDAAGNVGSDSVTYTVDNTAPVVTINAPVDGEYFNVGTVDVAGTALDGVGVLTVEVDVDGGGYSLAADTSGVNDWSTWAFTTGSLSVGTHIITARATDLSGNIAETSVDISVGATSLTYTGDLSGQYSDPVTVSAHLEDLATNRGIHGKSISFTIGTQTVSATTNENGDASTTITLLQASGSYNVVSSFAGDSTYGSSDDFDPFTISKETATILYTGDTYVSTAGETIMEAPVRLSATITEDGDGYPGNLALATVKFTLEPGIGSPVIVGNVPVNSAGEALATVTVPCDSYIVTVDIETANPYWESDIDTDTLQVETGDGEQMVTGGGWIPYEQSTNGKVNFGFTVQYNKKGAPKGSFVAVFKSTDGFVYKIKSTSWCKGGLSFKDVDEAFFTATCVVQKIDRATGDVVESWGNYKIMVDITDGDYELPQNGRADQIAIAVLDKDFAIWLQWGTSSEQILLGGGNIAIHSGQGGSSEGSSEDSSDGKGKGRNK